MCALVAELLAFTVFQCPRQHSMAVGPGQVDRMTPATMLSRMEGPGCQLVALVVVSRNTGRGSLELYDELPVLKGARKRRWLSVGESGVSS